MTTAFAVLALVFNATTWGLAWLPIRMLTDAGLHPLWATAMIYVTATAGLALVLRGRLGEGLRQSRGLWWLAAASGLTNASFNWAVTLTDVARVALLFYLMPVWAALLARWLLKEPVTGLVIVRIAVALAGAGLVFFDPLREPGTSSWLADALAVTAGMSFAVNTVLLRRVAGQSRGAIALAMFSGAAATPLVVGLLMSAAGSVLLPLPSSAGVWILVVAATATAYLLGNLALQYGAARLPANTTALIMLTEVAVAAASGALIAGEVLTSRVLIGGLLIIAAAASSVLVTGRRPGRAAGAAG